MNDRFPLEQAAEVRQSLSLQRVRQLRLKVWTQPFDGSRKVRAEFLLGGLSLRLAVTDVDVEHRLRVPGQEEIIDDALVCLSLGEPFHGAVYKLVAAVITEDLV